MYVCLCKCLARDNLVTFDNPQSLSTTKNIIRNPLPAIQKLKCMCAEVSLPKSMTIKRHHLPQIVPQMSIDLSMPPTFAHSTNKRMNMPYPSSTRNTHNGHTATQPHSLVASQSKSSSQCPFSYPYAYSQDSFISGKRTPQPQSGSGEARSAYMVVAVTAGKESMCQPQLQLQQ